MFMYQPEFYMWHASTLPLYFLLFSLPCGIIASYFTFALWAFALGCLAIAKAILLYSWDPGITNIIRVAGYLAPAGIAAMYCLWRGFIMDFHLRLKFIKAKQLEIKLAKLKEEQQRVKNLLRIMLPEVCALNCRLIQSAYDILNVTSTYACRSQSIIPRLEASNFQFSTVSDRVEKATCIFIDFFDAHSLIRLPPQRAVILMTKAFLDLDVILRKWPKFEKIKTVSSKALLFAQISSEDTDSFGVKLTKFSKMVLIETRENDEEQNSDIRRCIKIGIATGSVVAGIQNIKWPSAQMTYYKLIDRS
jgi:hypothetical protein